MLIDTFYTLQVHKQWLSEGKMGVESIINDLQKYLYEGVSQTWDIKGNRCNLTHKSNKFHDLFLAFHRMAGYKNDIVL